MSVHFESSLSAYTVQCTNYVMKFNHAWIWKHRLQEDDKPSPEYKVKIKVRIC